MEVKYIRIILIPNFMDFNTSMDDFMHDLYIEFLGDDGAIFRIDVFHSHSFHCKILNMA
jgi:hypothetical protein